jgi:hypothetical protein
MVVGIRPAKTSSNCDGECGRNAREERAFKGDFELPVCPPLATSKQWFRLLETVSAGTISGWRSSVSEMTGKSRARTLTIATASILVLCLGFRRDTVQWNRHSQIAATVTASQTRLRSVSIGSSYAIRGEARASVPSRRREPSRIRRSLQRRAVRRQTFRFPIYTGVLVWKRQR